MPSSRAREKLTAPSYDYTDDEGNVLTLRGSLTPASRVVYAETLTGGLSQEDAWQRATELLFERLAVSWTIAGLETKRQKELLTRYRVASASEREFVRDALRSHLAEHFPELQAP
ncbi:MAG TPA: hypothetical protein VMU90_14225 [Solirubrobacteraceae bacterium]|nr:hypothetical protein [Solirubrobacteraceae bacterium]